MKVYFLTYNITAVSCSPDVASSGGLKMGIWLTGKLGRAWVGAWPGAWVVHGIGVPDMGCRTWGLCSLGYLYL